MENNIKIKHFNGLESEWQSRLNASAYDNDIVFAKVWNQDPSSHEWDKKLIIYAGKDQYRQEYSYVVPDFDTFIKLEARVNILEGRFTDSSFKEALENYIKDSSKISQIDTAIAGINEKVLGIDSSINDINASIGDINVSLGNINVEIGDINLEISDIKDTLVDIDTSISNLGDDVSILNTSVSALEEAVRWITD